MMLGDGVVFYDPNVFDDWLAEWAERLAAERQRSEARAALQQSFDRRH